MITVYHSINFSNNKEEDSVGMLLEFIERLSIICV